MNTEIIKSIKENNITLFSYYLDIYDKNFIDFNDYIHELIRTKKNDFIYLLIKHTYLNSNNLQNVLIFFIKEDDEKGFDLLFKEKNINNRLLNSVFSELSAILKKDSFKLFIKLLDKKGIEPSRLNNKALINACKSNNLELVNIIINHNNSNTENYINALIESVITGNEELVKIFLSFDFIVPSMYNNDALYYAYNLKYYNIIKLLWNYEDVKNNIYINNKKIYQEINKIIMKDKIIKF